MKIYLSAEELKKVKGGFVYQTRVGNTQVVVTGTELNTGRKPSFALLGVKLGLHP